MDTEHILLLEYVMSEVHELEVESERSEELSRKAQQARSRRNAKQALAFEKAMFEDRSRHLILVLTLNYKEQHRHEMTHEDMTEHRNRLFDNARSNDLLRGMKAAWKIEDGHEGGGLHMHLVGFYDGSNRNDVQIAKSIGEYWENQVTRGYGAYRNSNADKKKNAKGPYGDFTGQVDRSNVWKREGLQRYLSEYIAKSDQAVMSDDHPHSHRFGTSRLPKR